MKHPALKNKKYDNAIERKIRQKLREFREAQPTIGMYEEVREWLAEMQNFRNDLGEEFISAFDQIAEGPNILRAINHQLELGFAFTSAQAREQAQENIASARGMDLALLRILPKFSVAEKIEIPDGAPISDWGKEELKWHRPLEPPKRAIAFSHDPNAVDNLDLTIAPGEKISPDSEKSS